MSISLEQQKDTLKERSPLLTSQTIPFPYEKPYPQQQAFMDTLLQGLHRISPRDQNDHNLNKESAATVMMMESPTGTGKSLSLACAAMSWLRHQEHMDLQREEKEPSSVAQSTSDDWWNSWVPPDRRSEESNRARESAAKARQELATALSTFKDRLPPESEKDRFSLCRGNLARSATTAAKMEERGQLRRQRRRQHKHRTSGIPVDYCLENYRSEESDAGSSSDDGDNNNRPGLSKSIRLLEGGRLDGSHGTASSFTVGNVQAKTGVRKVIYAARTHSQLSQFVGELKRTHWGSTVRVVALGGRKILCGNAQLRKTHHSESALTEACLDLKNGTSRGVKDKKRKSTKSGGGCPLLESDSAVSTLGLHLMSTPTDIEEAARLGEASHTCAYYASRKGLAAAEVVVLPYSLLLSPSNRDAVGLSLKGALVIVDEAHNLPEALRQVHSATVQLPVAQQALAQLTRYTKKYADRLTAQNLMYLGQLRRILIAFVEHLEPSNNDKKSTMVSTGEFLIDLKLDNINIFKLLRFMERSRLSQKLLGFNRALTTETEVATNQPPEEILSKHVSAMSVVQTLLQKLNLKGMEGKVATDWHSTNVQCPALRYVLLHPASCFANVLKEAHALALVGGTLSPFGHLAAELLGESYFDKARQADQYMKIQLSSGIKSNSSFVDDNFVAFSCDHVVSPQNVMVQCLSMGPSNQAFDFRHQSRLSKSLCDELGRLLVDLASNIPSGLVVFLPSYNYEAHLVQLWKESGVWAKINKRKPIHREPKSASELDSSLKRYAHAASTNNGALLLAVIGGKMSEGINLANEMARGVVIVGLPYADITSPEIREKMENLDRTKSGLSGQDYYQNLCMRAVNQTIGRAIRHADDYAVILLCDYRFTRQKIWSGLPQWLRKASIGQAKQPFHKLAASMKRFFQARKQSNIK